MSYDYFESLSLSQRKLIQQFKDFLDEENNAGRVENQYVICRKLPILDAEQYQVIVNNFDSKKNDAILAPFFYKDEPLTITTEFDEPKEEEEEREAEIGAFESIKSNNHAINEQLKFSKRISDIECDIPANGLKFFIKLQNKFNIKTIGIKFNDGNVSSYKFNILFLNEDGKVFSEIKSQRNKQITSLMEFYILDKPIENVDRIVFHIISKFNIKNIVEHTAKIGDFLVSDSEFDEGMSKLISCVDVETIESNTNYANHPSLVDLRVATNQENYPTLYELQSQNQYTQLDKINNEKEIKIYSSVLPDNVIASSEGSCLIRIGNKDVNKYPDDHPVFSLSTLKQKGIIRYGGYKNHFVAFKMIPIEFKDNWDLTFITRGGDIEDNNPNNFHAIIKMNSEEFSFTRQLVENKADSFVDEVIPQFPLKITKEQEIGIIIYQFNISETDVQYYIYIKRHNDLDWKLYNQFIDSKDFKGENYGEQTVFWGGLYDYLFFNNISKLKLIDLTVGELVTPIRKVE